jgi:hypothetical protein
VFGKSGFCYRLADHTLAIAIRVGRFAVQQYSTKGEKL